MLKIKKILLCFIAAIGLCVITGCTNPDNNSTNSISTNNSSESVQNNTSSIIQNSDLSSSIDEGNNSEDSSSPNEDLVVEDDKNYGQFS